MLAGLSPSLSTAIRTAGEARTRMDSAARQIATGQRVASAKDDGAAFARAAGLRSQKAGAQAREASLGRFEAAIGYSTAMTDQGIAAAARLKELVLEARNFAPGSTQRAQLQAEWAQVVNWVPPDMAENPAWGSWAGHGWQPNGVAGTYLSSADPMTNGVVLPVAHNSQGHSQWFTQTDGNRPVALATFDLLNATGTQLDQARTSATYVHNHAMETWGIFTGNAQNWLDRTRTATRKEEDRLDTAISSITDADMGKASAELRQSETRQQLALQTVRQALDAYGAYADGLLGNAQRTQRALA